MKRIHQMNLKVLLPTRIFTDSSVSKIIAESSNGSFCLLPNHIDFTTALVPGIMECTTSDIKAFYLAVDEGILVKQQDKVLVSVFDAIQSDDLEELENILMQKYIKLNTREKKSRAALTMLEGGIIKKVQESLS